MQHLQILSFVSHLVVFVVIYKLLDDWTRKLMASIPFVIAMFASLLYHFCMWIDTGSCVFSMHIHNRIDTCAAAYLVWVFGVYLYPHTSFRGFSLKGFLITYMSYPHVAMFVIGIQDYIIISIYGAVGVVSFVAMYTYKKKLLEPYSIEIQLCLNRIVFYGIIALSCFYSSSISYTASMYWITHPIWHLTSFIMIYYVIECQEIINRMIKLFM